jgi:hypothetical protein
MSRNGKLDSSFAFLDDLLAAKLDDVLNVDRKHGFAKDKLSIFVLPLVPEQLRRLTSLLYENLYGCLRTVYDPIPRNTITGLRENYCEQLPKTMRFKSAHLTKKSKAGRAADLLGVTDILSSERLRIFGESVTGKRLQKDPGCQVICYEGGDFSGPHNDHHPEQDELRAGYVDVHIMLSEPTVLSQLLVYEKQNGLLNEVREMGRGLAVAVYQLPFWHYTTPLMPRADVNQARRWLFLASYLIDRQAPRPTNIKFET